MAGHGRPLGEKDDEVPRPRRRPISETPDPGLDDLDEVGDEFDDEDVEEEDTDELWDDELIEKGEDEISDDERTRD